MSPRLSSKLKPAEKAESKDSGTSPPFSKLKPVEKFERKWSELGFGEHGLHREHYFDPARNWRFDFAWPRCLVAVEIDGFGYGHQAQQNIMKQNEKRNAAIEAGWVVLVYDSRLIGSHGRCEQAVEQVCRVLRTLYPKPRRKK